MVSRGTRGGSAWASGRNYSCTVTDCPGSGGVTILGVFQNQGMWHWADGQRAWGGGGMGVVASGFFSSLNGSVIPWVDTVGVG